MKTSHVNGEDSGIAASSVGAPAVREKQVLTSANVGSVADVLSPAAPAAKAGRHEPAFTPPQDEPALPRDEHHGKGGMYAMVDGKRVPADDEGHPLPPKGRK